MARHVDERERFLAGRQRRPGVAELDGEPAPALLLEPVGLHPGERFDQRRFAVVDMTRRRDDVHREPAQQRGANGGSEIAIPLRRHRARVDEAAATRERRAITGGLAARSSSAQRSGSASAHPGSSSPGAPPPPTAPALGTGSPPPASPASLSTRACNCSAVACSACHVGVGGVRKVASSAASVSLSTRKARASGARRQRCTSSAAPAMMPACGPPSSLSPLAVTRLAPPAQRRREVRLVGQQRVGLQQAAADVHDDRRAQPGELGDIARLR